MIEQPNKDVQPYLEEDEMSLKDVIVRIREYWAEIRRYWLTIVLICMPFILWQGYLAFTTPVTYASSLTFMVDEDTNGRSAMLSSLLGSFGIQAGQKNFDKILDLAKSMRIMRSALFQKVEIDGKLDYLANHFIRIQNIHEEEWYKKPKDPMQPNLSGFIFLRDSFEGFTRLENSAFKSLYGILIGDEHNEPLFNTKYNQDSGIMTLSIQTRSESLTIELLRAIFSQLSSFYIMTSTEKQQETYSIIKEKSDSIKSLLTSTEYRAAHFHDQNNSLIKAIDRVPNERFSRDKNMYSVLYGETVKNLELADFALKNKVPYVQPIDMPIPPLIGVSYSKKKALLIGVGLGLTLGILFVLVRSAIIKLLNTIK
jgi:hypothetical protein